MRQPLAKPVDLRWSLLSAALIAIVVVLELALGAGIVLIGLLIASPLVASLRLSPRFTAIVALGAVATALLLGFPEGMFGETAHLTRVLTVVLGGALAVWMARMRVVRERVVLLFALQGSVSAVLNQATRLNDARPGVLASIGGALGWQTGSFWEVDDEAEVLRRTECWSAAGIDAGPLDAASRDAAFGRGEGLPGRAWKTGDAVAVADVRASDLPRAPAARAAGLHGGFAFPLCRGDRVVGVIEYFSDVERKPDLDLLRALKSVGEQIGQYIDRMRIEAAVRASDVLKTAVLDSAFDCIVIMDAAGNVVDFNPAAERTFGYSRAEVIGREMAKLIIPPELRDKHREGLSRYLVTGEGPVVGSRFEITGWRVDGSRFPVELAVTRIATDGPPLFSGYIRDITDRKQSEDERTRLLEAEQAARRLAEAAEADRAESLALLDTLLSNAPVGLAFLDRELRYVRINESLATINGVSVEEHIGRTIDEVLPELPEAARLHRQVLETGAPLVDLDLAGETPATPGVKRHWLASYYPVSRAGETVGVGAVIVEITDRKRAERRAELLADASALLDTSLEYEATLANAVRIPVPALSDWCLIDVIDADGALRRHAVAHVDASREELARELDARYPADLEARTGRAEVIRSGRPQLLEEVSDALLQSLTDDAEHFRMLRELGWASALLVPLRTRGQTFGVMTLGVEEERRRFDEFDLAIARGVAERAATAIDNARLYRDRSYIARTLQESLLPPRLPEIEGVELGARYRAAGAGNDVGGDFYDIFPTGGSTWSLVIGDVRGKGAEAAALIGLARHTLRAAAIREEEPVRILATLNEALYREGSDESVCTALYAGLEPAESGVRLEITSAGHPLPLIRRADGRIETAGRSGTLMGAVRELDLHCEPAILLPGDSLVLYTDGVSEARSGGGGFFGQERLASLIESASDSDAGALAASIEEAVLDFQDGDPRDDVAILVIRVPPEVPENRTIPGQPSAAASA